MHRALFSLRIPTVHTYIMSRGMSSVAELTNCLKDSRTVIVDLRRPGEGPPTCKSAVNIVFDKTDPESFDVDKLKKAVGSDLSSPIILH